MVVQNWNSATNSNIAKYSRKKLRTHIQPATKLICKGSRTNNKKALAIYFGPFDRTIV